MRSSFGSFQIFESRISCCFLILLISTLPFLPFRVVFGVLSLPHLVFVLCAFLGFIVTLTSGRLMFSGFDLLLVAYLVLLLFGFVFRSTQGPDATLVLVKSVFYFLAFFFTMQTFLSIRFDQIIMVFRWGLFLGCFWTFLLLGWAAFTIDPGYLSYHGTTVGVYSSIGQTIFGIDDIESADVMRNVQGEIFSLYMAILVFLSLTGVLKFRFLPIFLFVSVLFTFSRRALLAVSLILAFFVIKKRGIGRVAVIFFSIILAVIFFYKFSGLLRSFALDETRLAQVEFVVSKLGSDWSSLFLGLGVGEKALDAYVHNFVISSFFMLGVPGLALSIFIFSAVLFRWCSSFFSSDFSRVFLVIPLLGLLVGSTAEGIFTIPGWLALIFSRALVNRDY